MYTTHRERTTVAIIHQVRSVVHAHLTTSCSGAFSLSSFACICPISSNHPLKKQMEKKTTKSANYEVLNGQHMFQSMLSSKLISADVCGTVMDSLSVQMAQVRLKLLLFSANFSIFGICKHDCSCRYTLRLAVPHKHLEATAISIFPGTCSVRCCLQC